MSDFTELQREILATKRDHPNASPAEIADRVGCSAGYARDILDEYDTAQLDAAPAPDPEPTDGGNSSSSSSSPVKTLFWLMIILPSKVAIKTTLAVIGLTLWLFKLVLPPYGS